MIHNKLQSKAVFPHGKTALSNFKTLNEVLIVRFSGKRSLIAQWTLYAS